MHVNEKATGRNWYEADSAKLKTGPDWARWELHWDDGGLVYGVEDSLDDAKAALSRYGFYPDQILQNNYLAANAQDIKLKALECMESGDPAMADAFKEDTGFTPVVFNTRIELDGPIAMGMEVERWRKTGFDPMVDLTGRKPASWVLKEIATGKSVMETFEEKAVLALNTEKYYAVPIHDHLAQVNGMVRDKAPNVMAKPVEPAEPKAQAKPADDSPSPGF